MLTAEGLMNIINAIFFLLHFFGKQKYGGAIFSIQIMGKESSFISIVHLIQSQNYICLQLVLHGSGGWDIKQKLPRVSFALIRWGQHIQLTITQNSLQTGELCLSSCIFVYVCVSFALNSNTYSWHSHRTSFEKLCISIRLYDWLTSDWKVVSFNWSLSTLLSLE